MTRYSLHSSTTNHGTVEQVVGEVRRVAQARLGGYWAPMLNGLDTMTALGVAAALVPEVEVATAVVPIPLRTPYALAQQALTVAELSGGRLTLGLGTSHRPLAEGIFRTEWAPPLATMTTYLAELRALMAGGQSERLRPRVAPPQVVLGAVNPKMAAIAAEQADGVVTWAAGPRTIEQVIVPAAASRTTAFRVVAAIPLCVTSEPEKVRAAIARKLGANDALPSYRRVLEREGVDGIASVAVVGDEGEVAAGLRRLRDAGVTEIAAHVVARGQDEDRTWALLADLAAQRSPNSLDEV